MSSDTKHQGAVETKSSGPPLPAVIWGEILSYGTFHDVLSWATTNGDWAKYCAQYRETFIAAPFWITTRTTKEWMPDFLARLAEESVPGVKIGFIAALRLKAPLEQVKCFLVVAPPVLTAAAVEVVRATASSQVTTLLSLSRKYNAIAEIEMPSYAPSFWRSAMSHEISYRVSDRDTDADPSKIPEKIAAAVVRLRKEGGPCALELRLTSPYYGSVKEYPKGDDQINQMAKAAFVCVKEHKALGDSIGMSYPVLVDIARVSEKGTFNWSGEIK